MKSLLDRLQEDYKFVVVKDDKADFVTRFIFEDGRAYKFQEPSFMELHEALYDGKNAQTAALEIGISNTFVENDKTPALNEEYLRRHKVEAFGLWTKLYAEVLFQDSGA